MDRSRRCSMRGRFPRVARQLSELVPFSVGTTWRGRYARPVVLGIGHTKVMVLSPGNLPSPQPMFDAVARRTIPHLHYVLRVCCFTYHSFPIPERWEFPISRFWMAPERQGPSVASRPWSAVELISPRTLHYQPIKPPRRNLSYRLQVSAARPFALGF
jgi:hypothetical protein